MKNKCKLKEITDLFHWDNIANDPRKILEYISRKCWKSVYCVDLEDGHPLIDDEVLLMLNDLCEKYNIMYDELYPEKDKFFKSPSDYDR